MVSFAVGSLSLLAHAEARHLGPHVHGQASVDVSVDRDVVEVQVSLPGHDAVGFEHPPGSARERDALARATAVLKRADWLAPTADAACRLASATVSPHGFDGTVDSGRHADIDAIYRYSCAQPARLDRLDVRLTAAFPAVQKTVVNVITAGGSDRIVLEGATGEVDLPR